MNPARFADPMQSVATGASTSVTISAPPRWAFDLAGQYLPGIPSGPFVRLHCRGFRFRRPDSWDVWHALLPHSPDSPSSCRVL